MCDVLERKDQVVSQLKRKLGIYSKMWYLKNYRWLSARNLWFKLTCRIEIAKVKTVTFVVQKVFICRDHDDLLVRPILFW